MRKKLGGADRQAFTTCADAGLCNEAYPPVAKSEPYFGPFDKLFNDFVYGGRRNIEGGT